MGSFGAPPKGPLPPYRFLFSKYWQIWNQTPSKQEITQVLGFFFFLSALFFKGQVLLCTKWVSPEQVPTMFWARGCYVYALQGACSEMKSNPHTHSWQSLQEKGF